MAFASLLTLLDDITTILDDVALLTKMAAKKTAGVVGDDLALNANQVTGVLAERELPIIWKVAKGSLLNKLILIPIVLLISWLLPVLITPLLMIGGAYLCFEGIEKILHFVLHPQENTEHQPLNHAVNEEDKIKGAIRTDFILSAEIIVIALSVVSPQDGFLSRAIMLSIIGIGMTVLVYGLVAIIVKLDDIGLHFIKKGGILRTIGTTLINIMPWFMRALSVIGTLAMFLVGGGIIAHGAPFIAHFLHQIHWHEGIMSHLANLIVGIISGTIICAMVLLVNKQRRQHT